MTEKSKTKRKYEYLFGPVSSRRLGSSLGVDIVPFKTCSYNCIYCQLGRTEKVTSVRKPYVAPEAVIDELKQWLALGGSSDYITFSGSGEPTLNSEIGKIIKGIKSLTDIPVCVITNGSLLDLKRVRDSILKADLVIPSLDAGCEKTFRLINRPEAAIEYQDTVDGLIKFTDEFKGKIYLEIFLVKGVNDKKEEILKIKEIVDRLDPDRIELNSIARPSAEKIDAPSIEKLEEIKNILGERVSIVGSVSESGRHRSVKGEDEMMAMLKRRPCRVEDIEKGLNIPIKKVRDYLDNLVKKQVVNKQTQDGRVYYSWKR